MYGYDMDYILTDALGKEYEVEVIGGLKDGLDNANVAKATEEQDLYEGTDCIVDGIRVDTTYAFSTKDHMHLVRYYEGLDMYMGIRTGNCHCKFDEPVVVVGNNYTDEYVRGYILPNLYSKTKNMAENIFDAIFDLFCEYEDYVEASI